MLASFLAHVLFAVLIPKFNIDTPKKPIPIELKIELVQPKPPEPIVIPEPPKVEPKPEEIKPLPKEIKQKPIENKPLPKNIEPKLEPIAEPTSQPKISEPTKVIAVEPKPDNTPAITVPPQPPEPPKKAEPTDGDFEAYRNSVQNELKRNIRYPKMAQNRGIQGEAKIEIKLDDEGNVISVTIVESSGSVVLDNAAIETVKRSNLKQYMKEILFGKLKSIKVPVAFVLADG